VVGACEFVGCVVHSACSESVCECVWCVRARACVGVGSPNPDACHQGRRFIPSRTSKNTQTTEYDCFREKGEASKGFNSPQAGRQCWQIQCLAETQRS
jgi:hypothetical protein